MPTRPIFVALFALTLMFPWLSGTGCGAPPDAPTTTILGAQLLGSIVYLNPLFAIGPVLLLACCVMRKRLALIIVVALVGSALTLYAVDMFAIVFVRTREVHAAFYVAHAWLIVVALDPLVRALRVLRDRRRAGLAFVLPA